MFARALQYLPTCLENKLTACYFRARAFTSRNMAHAPETVTFAEMDVQILRALSDNFMYLLIDKQTREAAIVDPVAPEKVVEAARTAQVELNKVLTTHHHWDHAGGNEQLLKLWPKPLVVYGGDERIGALTHKVQHAETFKLGALTVRCLHTPCHTRGHICYHVTAPNGESIVFTGDTLFQGGCGRFFEGNAAEMYEALYDKLGKLPADTKVFCGHEYSLQNLSYAQHVEPQNAQIAARIEAVKTLLAANKATVPTSIAEERTWNPFMRVDVASVQQHAGATAPIEVMAQLRNEKNNF